MRVQRPNPIPLISFLVIQIFWFSLYSQGFFILIGGIKAQIVLLIIWIFTLSFFRGQSLSIALTRLEKHKLELILLFVFVLVHIFYTLIGRGEFAFAYFVKSLLLLVTYVTVIISLKNDYQRYIQAAIITTLVLGFIAICVLPIIYTYPLIGRMYEYQTDEVSWFGSWGFFMTYAIAMPCLIAVARQQHGLLKVLLYVLCFSMVLLILFSTFSASILLLVLGFAGFFLFSIKKTKSYLITALTLLMIILILMLSDESQIRELENISEKLKVIFLLSDSEFSSDDGNSPQYRFYLMKGTMNTFFNNPFFGSGAYDASNRYGMVGGHSGIIDSLAQFGMLGIIWYLIFLVICFRRLLFALRVTPNSLIIQGRFLTFILFLIGAIANPMFLDPGISALVFILALSPIDLNAVIRKTKPD